MISLPERATWLHRESFILASISLSSNPDLFRMNHNLKRLISEAEQFREQVKNLMRAQGGKEL